MAKNDEQVMAEKQVAISAQSFQQLETIATELQKLNKNIEAWLKFNHVGE